MTISQALLNLPARLRARGVHVVEMEGWRTRDRRDGDFQPIGIVDHHDGMGLDNDNVPNNMIREGQNGAQIWVSRHGSVYMMAAGRMWHAGVHNAWGDFAANSCNKQAVGIETDYSGAGPWPPALLVAWRILRHELAQELGITPALVGRRVAAHKEIAPDRKPDPANLDEGQVRADLVADLSGRVDPATPPTQPASPSTDWFNMINKDDEAKLRAIFRDELDKALEVDDDDDGRAVDEKILNPETGNRNTLGQRVVGFGVLLREVASNVYRRLDKIEKKVGIR